MLFRDPQTPNCPQPPRMPSPASSIQQREELRQIFPMIRIQLPGRYHTVPLPNPETHYLTIPLPKHGSSFSDVLAHLISSRLTDDYKDRHATYYYEMFQPLPCLRTDLHSQHYPPRSFKVPLSLGEGAMVCREMVRDGQRVIKGLLNFRDRIERHFGPFLDRCSEMIDAFRVALPPATTDGTRAANEVLISNHTADVERRLRLLYNTCGEGCCILTVIGRRFEDLEYFCRRSMGDRHTSAMPPLLAQVFLGAGIWHCKVKGALLGMNVDWERAQIRHIRHRLDRAVTEEIPDSETSAPETSEAETEREPPADPRTPRTYNYGQTA